ncbi:O-methyltransferase [Sporosarcina sp. Marseille-Q4063]|nr:O-methyltransferase [Sporosarcina sp. Marseille-Q4063]QUW23833.1 O-methyltransferase [Sporosarcina sp. Marseille-Q4063]
MITYDSYIAGLLKEKNSFIIEMEEYAEKHHVPIMDSSAIETLLGLLSIQKPDRILEIGSAIGYSAIRMAQSLPDTFITTIERDQERYLKAVDYIEAADLSNRIQIIEADALLLESELIAGEPYNALFIDAAKGQYKRFFEKYSPFISSGGVIYCDNMFLHGMVLRDDKELPRRKRTMVRNLKSFTRWVLNHPDYVTSLFPLGDGILIAIKK